MQNLKHLCLLLLICLGANAQFKKVGYMPSWAGDANNIQYSKLTHIIYAFGIPNWDGTIMAIENPGKLTQIVNNAHANNCKVLIAIGGWSYQGVLLDGRFESFAASAQGRTNMVNACINIVNQYGLDGVDVDWEYPDAGASANNFAALIDQLGNAMHSRGKVVSAAIPHQSYFGGGYNSSALAMLDWVNLMAYDENDFQHSTYEFAVSGLNYWTGTKGLAKSKAVLGVPAYGRPSWESYATLLSRGASPTQDVFGGVGYNGTTTVARKAQYVKDNNFGGVMIWELSQDVNNANSLVSTFHNVLGSGNPPPPTVQEPYTGTPINLPGTIEAENYDKGGQTVAYNDVTSNNEGAAYRTDAVDIEACTEGGFNVGWIAPAEWLEYTVSFTTSATYTFEARVAATAAGSTFRIELDGQRIGSTLTVPNTGSWQGWQSVSMTAAVTAGKKVLRIYTDQGNFNLNKLVVSTGSNPPNNIPPTVSLTSPANGSTFSAGAAITVSATAADQDGTVSKVEFYSNGNKIGEDASSPYSISWNAGAGSHSITAKATDNGNASTVSGARSITVTPITTGCTVAAWTATAVYTQGMRASYNGTIFEAKWWTQGNNPSTNSGTWDVWKVIGPCSARSLADADQDWFAAEVVMHASPNPTSGVFDLSLDLPVEQSYTMEIRSSMNEVIFKQELTGGTSSQPVDLSNQASGVYIIMIKSDSGNKMLRVVKQ